MTAASQESVHFPDITPWMGLWAGERVIRTNLKTEDEALVDLGLVSPHSAASLLKS